MLNLKIYQILNKNSFPPSLIHCRLCHFNIGAAECLYYMTGPGQWTLAFHVLNLIRLNTYLDFTDISRSTHLPMQALTTRQTGPLVIQVFLLCKFCRTYRFPSDIVVQIWVNNPAHRRLLNPSNLKSKTFSKSGDNISNATTLYHCTLPSTEHLWGWQGQDLTRPFTTWRSSGDQGSVEEQD